MIKAIKSNKAVLGVASIMLSLAVMSWIGFVYIATHR